MMLKPGASFGAFIHEGVAWILNQWGDQHPDKMQLSSYSLIVPEGISEKIEGEIIVLQVGETEVAEGTDEQPVTVLTSPRLKPQQFTATVRHTKRFDVFAEKPNGDLEQLKANFRRAIIAGTL